MLGDIIARLDDPGAAEAAVIEVGGLALLAEVRAAADLFDLELGAFVSLAVRRFVERADDDAWLDLVGVMGRGEMPGSDALATILRHAVTDANEVANPTVLEESGAMMDHEPAAAVCGECGCGATAERREAVEVVEAVT